MGEWGEVVRSSWERVSARLRGVVRNASACLCWVRSDATRTVHEFALVFEAWACSEVIAAHNVAECPPKSTCVVRI